MNDIGNSGDLSFMRMALSEAQKCIPTPTAFCVGCVLVARYPSPTSTPVVLSTGYSRELPGNTHAEANALTKLYQVPADELAKLFPSLEPSSLSPQTLLRHADVYTTMEPCSVRTSGLSPCSDALIAAGIARCVIGVGEPDDFVNCEGAQKLQNAGIPIVWLDGLQEECLATAREGHAPRG